MSHLPKSSSKPLCKACPGCGGMVRRNFKVSCSCGHVFVDKHLLNPSRKHTLRSFRATQTVEKAVDQLTKSLETEEELSIGMQQSLRVDFKVDF